MIEVPARRYLNINWSGTRQKKNAVFDNTAFEVRQEKPAFLDSQY